MKVTKNVPVLLAMLALLVMSLACSLFSGGSKEMSLENLRMALDEGGNYPTTGFSSSDIFYIVGDLKNALAGTVVEAKWLAMQIEGYSPGELIYEQAINDFTDESFNGTIYFELSNDAGWVAGEYKADVYLDGAFVESVPFSVR